MTEFYSTFRNSAENLPKLANNFPKMKKNLATAPKFLTQTHPTTKLYSILYHNSYSFFHIPRKEQKKAIKIYDDNMKGINVENLSSHEESIFWFVSIY